MHDDTTIRLLKWIIAAGLCLLAFGHYLWAGLKLHETMGVKGMVLIAVCSAVGLILSLPTKMYLTFLLMKREQQAKAHSSQPPK